MPDTPRNKGPWIHRFLIGLFTVALAFLIYWLIGFVMRDIGTLRGPDRAEVEKKFLNQALVAERDVTPTVARTATKLSRKSDFSPSVSG